MGELRQPRELQQWKTGITPRAGGIMAAGGNTYIPEPGLPVEAGATAEAAQLGARATEGEATTVEEVTISRGTNTLTFPISALLVSSRVSHWVKPGRN